MIAEDAKNSLDLPLSFECFMNSLRHWNYFHSDEYIDCDDNLTWEEMYKQRPECIRDIYHDTKYTGYYSAIEESEEFETAYLGCAGKFDRNTLNFFHKTVDEWLKSGPLPVKFDPEED